MGKARCVLPDRTQAHRDGPHVLRWLAVVSDVPKRVESAGQLRRIVVKADEGLGASGR